ncbi:Hypothetical predicted protein [Lecanosticta acicola]|uniref:S-adenosyl-L-methionine-dependent methyltransferase n=1 Tax=Lecanosticta acicola TaxID=111012 RepID=A0AAI8YSD4_9PEZI|nr:Hypothetical predicted protein [Lecanosticta acicola]
MAAVQAQRSLHHHGDKTSCYMLPNDDMERHRLHLQHLASVALLGGDHIKAPLQDPKKIIDIGCGVNADMTLFLAERFPNAKVYGVDLSPIHLENVPPNVEFIQGNVHHLIGKDERLQPGTFDFVFWRYLCMGVPDWEEHVSKVARLVREGGWVEMHEHFMPALWKDDRHVTKDSEWFGLLTKPKPWPEGDPFAVQYFQNLFQAQGFSEMGGLPVSAPFDPPEKLQGQDGQAWARYVAEKHFIQWVYPIMERLFPGEEGKADRARLAAEAERIFATEDGKHFRFAVVWGRKV